MEVVFSGTPMLAKEYVPTRDRCKGMWLSEKMDGYRAIWNGAGFVSRTGKPFTVPAWFSAAMPPGVAVDGELWAGRGRFEACGVVRKKTPVDSEWTGITFVAFDVPSMGGEPFEKRLECLCTLVLRAKAEYDASRGAPDECPFRLAKQQRVASTEHMNTLFDKVIGEGGEGIMLRRPGSLYEQKRSKNLLKRKKLLDTEATIVGYKEGRGKYAGKLGSFRCILLRRQARDGGAGVVEFCVSGMSDEVRANYRETHPVGTIITVAYNDTTRKGVPRHPRYLRPWTQQ